MGNPPTAAAGVLSAFLQGIFIKGVIPSTNIEGLLTVARDTTGGSWHAGGQYR